MIYAKCRIARARREGVSVCFRFLLTGRGYTRHMTYNLRSSCSYGDKQKRRIAMPIVSEGDEKIRNRFEQLIREGTELAEKMEEHSRLHEIERKRKRESFFGSEYGHTSEYRSLVENCISLVGMVLGNSDRAKTLQKQIAGRDKIPSSIQQFVGILAGLKDDYEKGFLNELQELLLADISADYIGQAEALLNEGTTGQYDHVPAAVLCGAVLEDRLRRWCDGQTPPISTTRTDGSNKTLGPLLEELRKAKKFDKLVLRQLQGWADIRNHAAHGEFDKFSKHDVEQMLSGVQNFLVNRLGTI